MSKELDEKMHDWMELESKTEHNQLCIGEVDFSSLKDIVLPLPEKIGGYLNLSNKIEFINGELILKDTMK
jgi:hypothetical protein